MGGTLEIRQAGVDAATEVLELQRLAYRSEADLYNDWTIPPLTQTREAICAEFAAKVFLIAELAGRLAGSVRAGQDGGTCRIGRLIVHPDVQGQGIGTRLMRAIEARFGQAKRFELFTGSRSTGNIRLYHRLGYRIFQEQDLSPRIRIVFLEKLAGTERH